MRIAVADLGSHTFHLLCANVDGEGAIVPELSRKHALRLGASLCEGRIPPDAWERAMTALTDLAAGARLFGGTTFAVGTSVIRETDDGRDLARAAHRILGVPVQILTGHEEAELVFLGARSALPPTTGRVAVIDLGGGSLEVALGDATSIAHTWSLPLGALRLRELAPDTLADHVLDLGRDAWAGVRAYEPETIVLTGGSARLVATLLGSSTLAASQAHELAARLAALDHAGRIAMGVPEARADTIATAASIFAAVIAACDRPASISPRGLREGFIVRAARR